MKIKISILKRLIIILFLLSNILNSCKTLNSDISYSDLIEKTSPKMQSLMNSPDYSTCYHGEKKHFGDILLKCNLWGKNKIKKGTPHLCVYKKGNLWGWKWDIPHQARGVIGYPAIQVGINPQSKGVDKKAGFPVKVSLIKELKVDYDVETYVKHKKFNLAFDLWLVDSDIGNKRIEAEIMIWEDYFDFSSYGKKKEVILTPFGSYKVLIGYLKNPKYKQDWMYIAFVRTDPRTQGTVDINYLLNYLVENNLIEKDNFLTTVEFGNEIGNSSGYTMINKFEWSFEIKD